MWHPFIITTLLFPSTSTALQHLLKSYFDQYCESSYKSFYSNPHWSLVTADSTLIP